MCDKKKDELIKRNEREKIQLNQVDLFSTYHKNGAFQRIINNFAPVNGNCSKKKVKTVQLLRLEFKCDVKRSFGYYQSLWENPKKKCEQLIIRGL